MRLAAMTFAAVAGLAMQSCDSIIYDEEGDCTVHYRVPVSYTRHMKSSDALASEVTSVSLYMFDCNGDLAYKTTAPVADIIAADGTIPVDVAPGKYDIVAWGHGESNIAGARAFDFEHADNPSGIADLYRTLPATARSGRTSQTDLHRLYHGIATEVDFPDTYGTVDVDAVDMMKDTNVIRVMLQHYRKEELDKNDFLFTIYDDNGTLAYDNAVVSGDPVEYREWSKISAATSDDGSEPGEGITAVSTVIAELTTGRLVTSTRPILHITKKDGTDVLRLPLNDLLVLGKGEHNSGMSNQDFLDRQDQYSLVFLLDDSYSWYSHWGLYVNGWHVVYQNSEL